MSKTQDKTDKLNSERKADERNEKAFFTGLWLVNASTTFVFGMQYISSLFTDLLTPLRMGEYGLDTSSKVLGGVCAVLVLDLAYKKWDSIGLTAKTNEQLRYARIGKWTAFSFSIIFTAIVFLTTAFKGLVNDSLIETLDMVGAGMFIFVVALHLVCMALYRDNNIDKRRYVSQTKVKAHKESEQFAFNEDVTRSTLIEVANNTQAFKDAIVAEQSKVFMAELLSNFEQQNQLGSGSHPVIIEGTQTPQPSTIGFNARSSAEHTPNVSKAQLARNAIIDAVESAPLTYTDLLQGCVQSGHNQHTVKRAISELTKRGEIFTDNGVYDVLRG